MTDLLPSTTRRASGARSSGVPAPGGPGGPVLRPLWLAAAFAGAVAAGAVLTGCLALGLAGWFASDAGSHGDTRDAIRVGAVAWLMAHGSGLTLGSTVIGVLPLGLTALCGYVALRLGRWARLTSADEEPRGVALAALVLAAVYALVALVTAVLTSSPAARPGLMPAFSGAFLLALLAGGAGLAGPAAGSSPAAWTGRLPETARAIARGGLGVAVAMLAAGSLTVALALVLDLGTAATVLSRLHADGPGSALFTVLVAAVAPNAALLGGAYLLGPGFAVGTGTVVAPSAVVLGPVPAFPLLAALPDPGPGSALTTSLVALPALLAVVVGFLTVRRHPTSAFEKGAVRGLGAGVLGAVLVAVLVALAGGPVGPGRMADVGAPALDVLAAAVVALGLGAAVGGLLATWRLRRHGHPEDPADTRGEAGRSDVPDPDGEDTIRL